ncbi:hypothetical protein BJX65DRAFT_315393 [Aspergillus insuetus]
MRSASPSQHVGRNVRYIVPVFAPVAMFLYTSVGMLSGRLEDLSADQLSTERGIRWLVVPETLWDHWTKPSPQAVWHDPALLTPWDAYTAPATSRLYAGSIQGRKPG